LIILVKPDYFENQSIFPNGKYKNLTMTLKGNVNDLQKGLIEDLKAQNECIRNVMLVNFYRTNSIQALSVLRNITKLVIDNYRHENDVFGTIDLPNLRHLELTHSLAFAEVIDSQTLNILKIYREYSRDRYVDNHSDLNAVLNKILTKCHNLKDLTLSIIQITNPNLKSEFFEFNLEALSIEYFNFDEENLVEFLFKQKSSLKKLAILTNSPKLRISTIIFSHLTLDELEIGAKIIPSIFNPQMINRTVKKLTICSTFEYQSHDTISSTEKIILTCNEVEEFTFLDFSFDSLLQQINWNLKNLKVLRLRKIPFKFISPSTDLDNFMALEVIEIERIFHQQAIENCKFLVLNSPNLKTLKINYMERNIFTPNFFIDIVKSSKTLKEIHIGVSDFTLKIIDAIRQVKDLEHPLEFISVLFCSMDDKIGYDKNDALMDGLVLNFDHISNKFFSTITNDTRLDRMEREIDAKHNDVKNQRACGIQRKLQIEKYERDQDFHTDSSDSTDLNDSSDSSDSNDSSISSIYVDISDLVRNLVANGEIRMLRHQ